MKDKAETWLLARLSKDDLQIIEKSDGSVTFEFRSSPYTVARELVACGFVSNDFMEQILIITISDISAFHPIIASRGPLPSLATLSINFINKNCRSSKDGERLTCISETWIKISLINILIHRLQLG